MKQLLNNWLKNNQLSKFSLNFNQIASYLFQQNCVLCAANIKLSNRENHTREKNDALGANIHAVCRACHMMLPFQPTLSCPQCGLNSDGNVCGRCINSPPDFDATHAVFLYQFPIDAMMTRYKYGENLNLGKLFGEFLGVKIVRNNLLDNIDLIIPMPMHPARIKERGFNQALEIAKVLVKNLDKNMLNYKIAIRQKLTPPQASLPLKQRVKNIKGAFSVDVDLAQNLTGKRIAIVDDVMTSGASLNELAKTLKKAGAAHVECWVIARTLPHK